MPAVVVEPTYILRKLSIETGVGGKITTPPQRGAVKDISVVSLRIN